MKQAEIARLLPGIFQRTLNENSLMYALLGAMETLQAPSEAALEHIETWFDPRRAPDPFVPFLASWVDLDRIWLEGSTGLSAAPSREFPSGMGRLRELVAAAAYLSQWRGTAKGLRYFLEVATGIQGFVINEQVPGADGKPQPFHIQVLIPDAARAYRPMIQRIVDQQKPAYVTCELGTIPAPSPAQPPAG